MFWEEEIYTTVQSGIDLNMTEEEIMQKIFKIIQKRHNDSNSYLKKDKELNSNKLIYFSGYMRKSAMLWDRAVKRLQSNGINLLVIGSYKKLIKKQFEEIGDHIIWD